MLPNKASQMNDKSVVLTKDLTSSNNKQPNSLLIKPDSYLFKPNVIPAARQMFYQYCDIKAPEIEAMIARLPKISNDMICDPKHGFLPPGFDNQCRDIINKYVLEGLNKESANVASSSKEIDPDDSTDEEAPWVEEFEDEDVDDIDDVDVPQ